MRYRHPDNPRLTRVLSHTTRRTRSGARIHYAYWYGVLLATGTSAAACYREAARYLDRVLDPGPLVDWPE